MLDLLVPEFEKFAFERRINLDKQQSKTGC